jgi:alpha-N-arabinofuranosidase
MVADLQVECAWKGTSATGGTAQILHDIEGNAGNTFDNPDRIVPKPMAIRVERSRLPLDLPRLSVATAVVSMQ